MPRLRRSWMNSSIISRSMKSRIWSRGSISVTGTSSAEKIVAYSTPMTPAPTTVRLRGSALEIEDVVAVEDAVAVERHVVGPVRPGARPRG